MHITLSPIRADVKLAASKSGDKLAFVYADYVTGESGLEELDFSTLEEGATLPAEAIESQWITGPVERINGKLHLALVIPHGANAPVATRFPEPLIDPPDGKLALPAYNSEVFDE